MLEWLLRVVSLVNLNHQRNRRFLAVRPGFADVLARDRVNVFEIGVASPLRYPPAKLRFAVGIVHVNDGDGTRGSRRVFLPLTESSSVQMMMRSPSRPTHTGAQCGEPSVMMVAR